MTQQNVPQMNEDSKRMIRTLLIVSGAVFIAAGLSCLAYPATVSGYLGTNTVELGYVLGIALIMAGGADIAIAKILFKGNDRHD